MHRILVALLLCACSHSPAIQTARQLDTSAPSGQLTVLNTLTPAEGLAVRGALTELGGRLYGLAGEAGPNGSPSCSSTASWQTIEHTAHCPGSLFSLALDGSDFRVEHAFSRLDDAARTNADGYHPYGTLAAGHDGRLYGVTQVGGAPTMEPGEVGYGVLFAYTPADGSFEVLHTFASEPRAADGEFPMGALAVDASGDVFGTAKGGGLSGSGTVFEWSPSGAFRYAPLPSGSGETYGGLVLANGLLHGTSWTGTATTVGGAYFTVDPVTLAVTVVARFAEDPLPAHGNDNTPIQEPAVLHDGTVIAPREFGGAAGTGVVVQLDPKLGITPLWQAQDIPLEAAPRFSNATGGILNGRIAEGRDGMLYGVAQYGGAAGTGGIYRIARDGSLFTLLWSWPDAAYPYGGVTLGSDGAQYGTTFNTSEVWRLQMR